MNKFLILVILIFSANVLKAQIILKKSELQTYVAAKSDWTFCCTTDEDVVISFKKTDKGFKVSLQRNELAMSYNFHYCKLEKKKNSWGALGTYHGHDTAIILKDKKHDLFISIGQSHAFAVNLTSVEERKLLKYLTWK